MFNIITWSSANNSVNICGFFERGICFKSFFWHLVIFSFKYILKSIGERGKLWCTALLISASLVSLELNVINTLFCVHMSTIAFNNESGAVLDFRISNKICLYVLLNAFSKSVNNKCVSKLYSVHFSIKISGKMFDMSMNVPFGNHFVFLS